MMLALGLSHVAFQIERVLLYRASPKVTTRKLLELISDFGKVARNKINTQKSATFLYSNNKKLERKIKKTIPF